MPRRLIRTSRSVLVLSRNTDPDEVLFTRIGADDDTVATITLPANGDDWQAGAVAVSGGEAWVTWGDHLFDVTIATEAVHPVSVPWTHAVGASNGRSAGLAVADGPVWSASSASPSSADTTSQPERGGPRMCPRPWTS